MFKQDCWPNWDFIISRFTLTLKLTPQDNYSLMSFDLRDSGQENASIIPEILILTQSSFRLMSLLMFSLYFIYNPWLFNKITDVHYHFYQPPPVNWYWWPEKLHWAGFQEIWPRLMNDVRHGHKMWKCWQTCCIFANYIWWPPRVNALVSLLYVLSVRRDP